MLTYLPILLCQVHTARLESTRHNSRVSPRRRELSRQQSASSTELYSAVATHLESGSACGQLRKRCGSRAAGACLQIFRTVSFYQNLCRRQSGLSSCRKFNPHRPTRRDAIIFGARRPRASCSQFAHMCLCHKTVYFGTGQRVVMPCGWEGNRRSGHALETSGLSTYGLTAQGRQMGALPTVVMGYGTL